LVIITADHGCEHNDHKQGYWGYSSNLTDCQMQVPFAIVLPKKFQKKLELDKDDLTTHYDVVPTIMKNFLGVTSDIHNYSIGIDLFGERLVRNWSLAVSAGAGGGYHNYTAGIIEKGSSMHWFDSGRYWFTDDNNRTLINKQVNFKYLEQACEYMTRFFK
jgi:membrane-anchored protein YejM (alkaline phosphatase superfamily)